jgi:hypothetical protein
MTVFAQAQDPAGAQRPVAGLNSITARVAHRRHLLPRGTCLRRAWRR